MLSMNDLRNVAPNDLLQLIGLQKRRSASDWLLPAAGVFGAGLLVGAGLGLLLAPVTGKQLRGRMRDPLHRGSPESQKGLPLNGPVPMASRTP
jgi:hypothetical protein